jgi:hypothetical protein
MYIFFYTVVYFKKRKKASSSLILKFVPGGTWYRPKEERTRLLLVVNINYYSVTLSPPALFIIFLHFSPFFPNSLITNRAITMLFPCGCELEETENQPEAKSRQFSS